MDREILRALARLEAKVDGVVEDLKKQGRVMKTLVSKGSGASAVQHPEHDTIADMLPLTTVEEFRALEVLLQEKAKQQSLVCMNQHKYQRTVFRPASCYAFAVFVTLWRLIIRRYGVAANNTAESSVPVGVKKNYTITQQMAPHLWMPRFKQQMAH